MKSKIFLLIIIFFNLYSTSSEAGSCSSFLSKLVEVIGLRSYEPPSFNQETREAFNELRQNNYKESKNISFRDAHYVEGAFILSILPKEVSQYLKDYPVNREQKIDFKRNLDITFGFKSDSIMQNVYSILDAFQRRSPDKVPEQIDSAINRYKELSNAEKIRVEKKFHFTQNFNRANAYWQTLGRINLNTQASGNRLLVEIDGQHYHGKKIKKRGREVISLVVPVGKVKHPAWNPLNHQHLARLANDPMRVQKKEYDVVLGHDGNFYLMDGNHRFTFYDKSTVTVHLASPLKTESLRIFFDLKNFKQPSREKIMDIYDRRISPMDLIPTAFRSDIIFRIE